MIFNLNHDDVAKSNYPKNFTLVDGSFDPIHQGHIKYFDEAAATGLPVVCLIAPDTYTSSKHPVLLSVSNRAVVINSLKQINDVFFGEIATEKAIEITKPTIFFKGGDWKDKLSRKIVEACNKVGCEIRFGSDPIESSSQLLRKLTNEKFK
jgi:cytidyltransferase-like protein